MSQNGQTSSYFRYCRMKASVIMPPKFLAVFSNREKIRRIPFSQPISRSTTLRRRYASLSKSTSRASRSWFSFEGITGVTPKSSSKATPFAAPKGCHQAPAAGLAVAAPSPLTRETLRQSFPIRRLLTANEPSLSPPWQETSVSTKHGSGIKQLKYQFWDKA